MDYKVLSYQLAELFNNHTIVQIQNSTVIMAIIDRVGECVEISPRA